MNTVCRSNKSEGFYNKRANCIYENFVCYLKGFNYISFKIKSDFLQKNKDISDPSLWLLVCSFKKMQNPQLGLMPLLVIQWNLPHTFQYMVKFWSREEYSPVLTGRPTFHMMMVKGHLVLLLPWCKFSSTLPFFEQECRCKLLTMQQRTRVL